MTKHSRQPIRCTIVRAPAWRDLDPFSPRQYGYSEALYGVDGVLVSVSRPGEPIGDEQAFLCGCAPVTRRELIAPDEDLLWLNATTPQWPAEIRDDDPRLGPVWRP